MLFKSLARLPVLLTSCGLLVLSGCSLGKDHSDLTTYISDVKARPQGAIEPLPPLRTYDAYVYNMTAKRSPFDTPVKVAEIVQSSDPKIKPDFGREKEYLENFSFDSLSMVGTLEKDGRLWALVKDGLGGINRVTKGHYLGRDHGKITEATKTELEIIEIVSDGLGGWLQRPRTLKLSEKE